MAFDPSEIQRAFDAGRNLAPQAVGTNLLLMSLASILTILAFNLLRPKNKMIYQPRVRYHEDGKAPPAISDSVFGWLSPLIHTKEPELLEKIGLDAVTFLRFLRLMRTLFTGVAVLTCGILLPVNYIYNQKHVAPDQKDFLSQLSIRDIKGGIIYAHVAVSYLITFLTVFLVCIYWRDMTKLRNDWFRSPEYIQSFYARTISITHVPRSLRSDQGINHILNGLKIPYPTTSVHIGRKVGELPELIEYHNRTVREFEAVLVKFFKNGKKGKRRPTIRIGGCCGLGGTEKDAIAFYSEKLRRTEAAVESYRLRAETRKPQNYGFASLAAVPYAHITAKKLARRHYKGTSITLAPNPKDIIWSNMNMSDSQLARKQMIGFAWMILVCFLSLIPQLFVSVLANLDSVTTTGYLPFLDSWVGSSSISYTIFTGSVPPLVLAFFSFFLPKIMRWLTHYMGAMTHARLDRAVVARYFAFLVISQLVVFTLFGICIGLVSQAIKLIGQKASVHQVLRSLGFDQLPEMIAKAYISQTSFWLKYFPLRGFLVVFDLAQVINLLWISFRTRIFGRTPRDVREWTQPPVFEYAIHYSNYLFMAAVGLLFAPLAPLIALAAAIVFWTSSWVYKYQLMYIYITQVETGGRLWNVVINRLLVGLMMMQALMVLTVGLHSGFRSMEWISTIPPLFFVVGFKVYLKRKFQSSFHFYIPTQEELRNVTIHGRSDIKGKRLESRFGHPSLHAELFTPMVHAKMIPLLREFYKGKVTEETDKTKLNEYGGHSAHAQVLEGITIAAIEQKDLEYDPAMYQRDRGDINFDARSVASTVLLGSPQQPFFSAAAPSPQINVTNHFDAGSLYSASDRPPSLQPLITQVSPNLYRPTSANSSTIITPYPVSAGGIAPSIMTSPTPSHQTSYFDPRLTPQASHPNVAVPQRPRHPDLGPTSPTRHGRRMSTDLQGRVISGSQPERQSSYHYQ